MTRKKTDKVKNVKLFAKDSKEILSELVYNEFHTTQSYERATKLTKIALIFNLKCYEDIYEDLEINNFKEI